MRLLLTFVIACPIWAAGIYTAKTCNAADVNAVINGSQHTAVTGDTIIIPDGICTWTSEVNVPVGITLMGRAYGAVRLHDGIVGTETSAGCGAWVMICLNLDPKFHTTLANLQIDNSSGTAAGNYIVVQGTGLVALMHDILLDKNQNGTNQPFHVMQWVTDGGVIWNMRIQNSDNLTSVCNPPNGAGAQGGTLVVKMNKNWDDASTMGALDDGTHNLYIEDSYFTYIGQIPDVDNNARVVIRHTTYDTTLGGGVTHGCTSTTGGRHIEFYDDNFQNKDTQISANRYYWVRGGTMLATSNTIQALDLAPCQTNANSFGFIVEPALRSCTSTCCTVYACFHQAASGSTGVSNACSSTSPASCVSSGQGTENFQLLDPVYIWNNSGGGASSSRITTLDTGSEDGICTFANTATTMFRQNTEYFVDTTGSPTSGNKPGWSRFTYPHPLRGQRKFLTNGAQRLHARMSYALAAAATSTSAVSGSVAAAGTMSR